MRKLEFMFREAKTSPSFEQLSRLHLRLPVLVYEDVKIAQYLRFIRRYSHRLVFMGKTEVVAILLLGFTGYCYVAGTKYDSPIINGLLSIMATAKLDDRKFRVIDWYQKKGQLLVHVMKMGRPPTKAASGSESN